MNKVFKKILDKRTGEFIAVSENAKSKAKTKATTHGAIAHTVELINNCTSFFKVSALAIALSCTGTVANAAISQVSGEIGQVLSLMYNDFESTTSHTLSTEEINRLDAYYAEKIQYTVEVALQDNPDLTALELYEKVKFNEYEDVLPNNNLDKGVNHRSTGQSLTNYGSGNENIGIANTNVGIKNKTIGFLNNAVGNELNVVGDHNVAIGSNSTTLNDTGMFELNLQTMLEDQVSNTSVLSKEVLNKLYADGKITIEQYMSYSYNSVKDPVSENQVTGSVIYGSYNTSQGNFNNLRGDKNTNFGNSNTTVGNTSTTVGNVNNLEGSDNTVVGSNTNIKGDNNTVLSSNDISAFNEELKDINTSIFNKLQNETGDDFTEELQALIALTSKYGTNIIGSDNVSIGSGLTINANKTVSIGNNVTNNVDGSVAIGNNIVVEAYRAYQDSYLTGVKADNQVMFGGQRFTNIADGVNDTDGVALRQIETLASGYYNAEKKLVSDIESLNLAYRQDEEKLFKEVAAIIDDQKEQSKIAYAQEIDSTFADKTIDMQERTLVETMKGVQEGIAQFAETQYSTVTGQAIALANIQNKNLLDNGIEYANLRQQQETERLLGIINTNSLSLANQLNTMIQDQSNELKFAGESLIAETVSTKEQEGTNFIKQEDQTRLNDSLKLIDELASQVPTGGSNSGGLGSKESHWEGLNQYAEVLDSNVLNTAKDQAEIATLKETDTQKVEIDKAVQGKVNDALAVNAELDQKTTGELLTLADSKDVIALDQTKEAINAQVQDNQKAVLDTVSNMDDVLLQSAKNAITVLDQESSNRLNANLDALDKIVVDSGKTTIQSLDTQNYQRIQSQIISKDEITAGKAEQIIKDSLNTTQADVTDYITQADTAIWSEFEKHLGTGGGVISESTAISYANSQDVKLFTSSTLVADAGDQQVLNEGKAYADNKLQDLTSRINERDSKLQAGIAGAYALAGLPQASYPGQVNTSWALSSKAGQSAVAVGFSSLSDDSKWLFKSGAAADSKSKFSGGASVTRYILP